MEIEDLRLFRLVAKHGSISKAAEELHFVQSTVTFKIQRLESHFKTRLFYRHRYGVTLTPAGRQLLDYAGKIIHLVSEAEKKIGEPEAPKGPMAIGAMETTAAVRLPQALARFHRLYPEVDVLLKTGPTEELIQAVMAYELEGAFVAGPLSFEDLDQKKMFEEELVLLAARDRFGADSDQDLKRKSMLVFRQGCSYRKKLEEWLDAEGIRPLKLMEFGSLEAILGCVHAGLGYSLLPKSLITVKEREYSLSYREIPEEYGRVSTYFIHRRDVEPSLAVRLFLNLFTDTTDRIS